LADVPLSAGISAYFSRQDDRLQEFFSNPASLLVHDGVLRTNTLPQRALYEFASARITLLLPKLRMGVSLSAFRFPLSAFCLLSVVGVPTKVNAALEVFLR
jgi:hypothetical protein